MKTLFGARTSSAANRSSVTGTPSSDSAETTGEPSSKLPAGAIA